MVIVISWSSIKYVLSERGRLGAAKNVLAHMEKGGRYSCKHTYVINFFCRFGTK